MSGPSTADLSGEWQGIYNYPGGAPSVEFAAVIRDTAGTLIGTIREINDFVDPPGLVLEATIDGARDGLQVRFTKFYDTNHDDFDMVLYDGIVSDNGCEINGEWHIPGVWSGSFIMVRPRAEAVAVERQASETIR